MRLVGRSFKYHRPRGLLAAGVEEPNALVRVGTGARAEPNTRATQIELHDGLVAASQNAWPGLGFDLGGIADAFSMTLPAGFYYKTFMWPAGAWKFYEKFIRMAAGLGRAPREPDPDIYEKRHLHCDVLVIGAGPAGLAAARAAGGGGARVVLADDQPEPGGSLLASRDLVAGQAGAAWAAEAAAALAELPELRLLSRTTVASYLDHNYLVALERVNDHLEPERRHGPRHRLWKIRAAQVVLATGALERPLVFADNDRPGVMLAGAARTYLARYGVPPRRSGRGDDQQRQRLSRGPGRGRGRGSRSPPSSMSGRSPGARCRAWPANAASRWCAGAPSPRSRARAGSRASMSWR